MASGRSALGLCGRELPLQGEGETVLSSVGLAHCEGTPGSHNISVGRDGTC